MSHNKKEALKKETKKDNALLSNPESRSHLKKVFGFPKKQKK